jgi:hypothetical protein
MGSAVAIDGDLAAGGAPLRDGAGADSGGYDIFLRSGAGVWSRTQSVAETVADRNSGSSLALSGTNLLDGQPGDANGTGRATIDVLNAGTGMRTSQTAITPTGVPLVPNDDYGTSVAIDGNLAVVGAPGRGAATGDAFVFQNNAGTWTFMPPAASRKAPTAGEVFAASVGVDAASRVVVAGAPFNDITANDSGAFYEIIERLSNGDPCTADVDCASDFCIDAVCCNTLCGRTGAFGSEPTDDCQACSVARGATVSGTCAPRAASTVCRVAPGPCAQDAACDGTNVNCPSNPIRPNTFACRMAAAGSCDQTELCDGSSTTCPADQRAPVGTVCRPAAAGSCDIEETCDGSSFTCPANLVRAAGFVCRQVAGVCDVEETCDGSAATCPNDSFRGAGFECRAGTGMCDPAESCTGTAAGCPANAFATDGTLCTGGACLAGTCQPLPDLAGVDLSNFDLGGVDLSNIDLSAAPDAGGGLYGGGCACDLTGRGDHSAAPTLAALLILALLFRRRGWR